MCLWVLSYKKKLWKKNHFFASFKSLEKGVGSGAGSGSISQRYGSRDPDPDPHQNVTDPQHCFHKNFDLIFNLVTIRSLSRDISNRREIITVRGQSYVSRLQKYGPPTPLSARRVCPPPFPPNKGGGYTLVGRRGGWGVHILEDERHRIALLQ